MELNSEQTVKQPKEVFSRKHRAHCLNAVVGYWCKIAEHCKQILFPVITNWSSLLQRGQRCRNVQSIVDPWRERTKMNRVISILASATVGVVEFRRVWDRIKPIPQNTTDKCPKYNPKIGPLTDLHTRWHSGWLLLFYEEKWLQKSVIFSKGLFVSLHACLMSHIFSSQGNNLYQRYFETSREVLITTLQFPPCEWTLSVISVPWFGLRVFHDDIVGAFHNNINNDYSHSWFKWLFVTADKRNTRTSEKNQSF